MMSAAITTAPHFLVTFSPFVDRNVFYGSTSLRLDSPAVLAIQHLGDRVLQSFEIV